MRNAFATRLAAGFMLSALAAAPARAGAELRLASDDWCPFICARDGKINGGYLVELTAQALALQDIRVRPALLPLSRAMHDTEQGLLDGVYAPPTDRRLRLSVPLAYSRACFYTRADSDWTYAGADSLEAVTVGVIDDYGYDDGAMDAYIAEHRAQAALLQFAHGEAAGATNLHKLLRGRFQAMLEHASVAGQLAARLGVAPQIRQAGCLERALPLSIGFAVNDARAALWLQALAEGWRKLQGSEQLHALRLRYRMPGEHKAAAVRPR